MPTPTPTPTPSPTPAPKKSVSLDESSNGTGVRLSVGTYLIVTLRSPGDGGYSNWSVTLPPDQAVLSSVSAEHQEPTSGLPGDFGKDVFTFRAVGSGHTSLVASATQPWAGGGTVTFTLDVQVSKYARR
jgi:predicted secreted protein